VCGVRDARVDAVLNDHRVRHNVLSYVRREAARHGDKARRVVRVDVQILVLYRTRREVLYGLSERRGKNVR